MGAKINQKSVQKWSPRWNASRHRFLTFQWILGGKLGGKMDQKSIQKGIGKRIQKRNHFSMVLEFFWGGVPRAGHPDGWIVRPPKRPNTTGTGQMGLGKGKGLGKDTGQVDRMTHSRRRAKRGGGHPAHIRRIYKNLRQRLSWRTLLQGD